MQLVGLSDARALVWAYQLGVMEVVGAGLGRGVLGASGRSADLPEIHSTSKIHKAFNSHQINSFDAHQRIAPDASPTTVGQ